MIHVKLLNILPERSATGKAELEVQSRDGLTVWDVIREAGLDPSLVHLVVVNGRLSHLDALLHDGDRVVLSPVISGG